MLYKLDWLNIRSLDFGSKNASSSNYYYPDPLGQRSIVISLSVCPRNRLIDRHEFFVQIPCGRGSVLLWRRCDTLCTSGFTDDVRFGRNGRDAERRRLHSATAIYDVVKPGRSSGASTPPGTHPRQYLVSRGLNILYPPKFVIVVFIVVNNVLTAHIYNLA